MTALSKRLNDYIAIRRSLGYDLTGSEKVLRRFTAFADQQDEDRITIDLVLRWKATFGNANNDTWSTRLRMVRIFATWLRNLDARTEVPPEGLIAGKLRRARPHIYTDAEIARIVTGAAVLPSRRGLRGVTSAALLGLIAATGMRIGEATGLDDVDVDLDAAILTIRRGKNGKMRLVPIASSVVDRLRAYRSKRTRLIGGDAVPFFLNDGGQRPTDGSLRRDFGRVCQRMGLRPHQARRWGSGPRIHDLRHTFAVRTIMDWYRKGLDPDREMLKLSTYLGHSAPESTYWYIEAVPELMQLALKRAERSMLAGRAR
jgi:integrase/recombinase XerD